jgi:hypothetical protein
MAYEFVSVEKTPTLQQMKVSYCLERSCFCIVMQQGREQLKGGCSLIRVLKLRPDGHCGGGCWLISLSLFPYELELTGSRVGFWL